MTSPGIPSAPPFKARLIVTSITALITSSVMSFSGLAINYGFHPDFGARWLKAFLLGYVILVPVLLVLVPVVQAAVVSYMRTHGQSQRP